MLPHNQAQAHITRARPGRPQQTTLALPARVKLPRQLRVYMHGKRRNYADEINSEYEN